MDGSKFFESDNDLGLALNEMVNSDGIFNQQGSILHMAMGHQNGNSDVLVYGILYTVFLPGDMTFGGNLNISALKQSMDDCLSVANGDTDVENICLNIVFNNDYFWS